MIWKRLLWFSPCSLFGFCLLAQSPDFQKLKPELAFARQPADLSICEGNPAIFNFELSGRGRPRHLQWQTSVDGKRWSNTKGENSSIFQLTEHVRRAHNGTRVRAWLGGDERDTVFSKTATLWVESAIEFSKQPENQVVVEGGIAKFAVEIGRRTGSQPDLQWQFSPYATGLWFDLAGENASVLLFPYATFNQTGTVFRLRATTAGGCDSAFSRPAVLEVLGRPLVSVTPGTRTFCGGGNATFSVKMAGGSGLEHIQWQRSRDAGKHFTDIVGATDLFYMVLKITEEMNDWRFRAVVTLPGGQVLRTESALVWVHGAIAFTEQPRSVAVCLGDSAVFRVRTEFRGAKPTYQWQISCAGGSFHDLEGETGEKLALLTSENWLGNIRLRALIQAGGCQLIVSDTARLSVLTELKFLKQPAERIARNATGEFVFEADFAENGGAYNVSWQFSDDGGQTWAHQTGSYGQRRLAVKWLPSTASNRLFRMKVLSRECGRIYFSEGARVVWEN